MLILMKSSLDHAGFGEIVPGEMLAYVGKGRHADEAGKQDDSDAQPTALHEIAGRASPGCPCDRTPGPEQETDSRGMFAFVVRPKRR